MATATAGRQNKLNIQVESIKTAMSTMFTQIDDIYRSDVLNNDNRRKLFSFSKVLKRKHLTSKQYEGRFGSFTEQLLSRSAFNMIFLIRFFKVYNQGVWIYLLTSSVIS